MLELSELFAKRLTYLRTKKGCSAREMSLALGQNPSYINNIESGKALPSMSNFFYICEYLDVSPEQYFAFQTEEPQELEKINNNLRQLSSRQILNISEIIQDIIKK